MIHPYRLAVCEDDQIVRDGICRFCGETLTEENIAHEIASFSSAEELEAFLETGEQGFDLLVLDIKLEEKNGLELAKEVRRRNDRVSILFITGYEEYALAGYEVQPVHFLLKPLDWEKLREILLKDWRQKHRAQTVLLEKGRRKIRLAVHSILYVETDGSHGVQIILEDGSVKFPAGMGELEGMLPKGQFVRCHNSYIVNPGRVQECTRQSFYLDDGEHKLPVSRKYLNACQKAFVSYKNQ